MKRQTLGLIVAVLTFSVGIAASALWGLYRAPVEQLEEPTAATIELEPDSCFPGLSFEARTPFPTESYFPPGAFDSFNDVAYDFRGSWYSKHLKAMSEPALFDYADYEEESYRFLWLRSFHHPIAVRLNRFGQGRMLVVKQLSGKGGYEPGYLTVDRTRLLTKGEWAMFIHLLHRACYWQLPTEDESERGDDGAQWILEGVKEGRYHIVDRWSPPGGSYQEACLYLLKISGLGIDESGEDVY
jgi:hypothetical protein